MGFVALALLWSISFAILISLFVMLTGQFWLVARSEDTANVRRIGNHSVKALLGDAELWNPDSWRNSAQYANTWRNQIPQIELTMKHRSVIPDSSLRYTAIIHLRCSDVPFNRHKDYPLLPKAYYEFVASILSSDTDLHYLRVVNCFKHDEHPLASTKCPQFAQTIASWMRENLQGVKVSVDIECDDEHTTLSKFMGARWLVSTGGSFSFIPGMLKGRKFISPTLGPKTGRHRGLHRLVHWTMWPEDEIYETDETFHYS